MFEDSMIPSDTETHRTCSVCLKSKEFNEFYKDGKDINGVGKIRRDCKECYRKTRLSTRRSKKYVPPAPKPRARGRKKK